MQHKWIGLRVWVHVGVCMRACHLLTLQHRSQVPTQELHPTGAAAESPKIKLSINIKNIYKRVALGEERTCYVLLSQKDSYI